jgi:short-subunit dehydrogenase
MTYGDRGITVTALCPLGVETAMLATEDLLATRFVRGTGRVISPEEVAIAAVDALEAGRMLALPHPEVARMEQARAGDRDGWLMRMRTAIAALAPS